MINQRSLISGNNGVTYKESMDYNTKKQRSLN